MHDNYSTHGRQPTPEDSSGGRRPVPPRRRDYNYAEEGVGDPEAPITPPVLPSRDSGKPRSQFDVQLDVVRDRVRQVAAGHATGFILSGPGGLGKSYTVLKTLQEVDADCLVLNSHMTPKGLFQVLADNSHRIIVMEDMEHLFNNKQAAGVLRGALWSQAGRTAEGYQPRRLTWTNRHGTEEVVFTGGLIILMNGVLPDTPEMQAAKTRVPCLDMVVTDEMVADKMREIASTGFDDGCIRLSAEICREVCEFVIEEAAEQGKQPNLRMLSHGFRDRFAFDEGRAVTPWQELVRQQIQNDAPKLRVPETHSEVVQRELELVAELLVDTNDAQERCRRFHEATGRQRATFYRRKAELEARSSN